MNYQNIALLMTFLLGLFIVLGAVFAFFLHKKQKVLDFIFALAFSLIIMLIVLDLLPEAITYLGIQYLWLFLLFGLAGILLFKVLDHFIPEHEHHEMDQEEQRKNIAHIGVLATVALVLHNIIEGMAIYMSATTDISTGLMMSLGVGLHNIPLGMIISTTFYQSDEKPLPLCSYLLLLACSSFLGGLIPYCFAITSVNEVVMGCLLSLTLGMLLYIVLVELWPKVRATKNKKITAYGLLLGILLLSLTLFLE